MSGQVCFPKIPASTTALNTIKSMLCIFTQKKKKSVWLKAWHDPLAGLQAYSKWVFFSRCIHLLTANNLVIPFHTSLVVCGLRTWTQMATTTCCVAHWRKTLKYTEVRKHASRKLLPTTFKQLMPTGIRLAQVCLFFRNMCYWAYRCRWYPCSRTGSRPLLLWPSRRVLTSSFTGTAHEFADLNILPIILQMFLSWII